jgi:GNAT superfamily N-acetyltransferase
VTWSKEFVELDRRTHDRDSFDCGQHELNRFLRTQAAKHMAAGVSRTLILPSANALSDEKNLICSFYTIAPGEITRRSLPKAMEKKLPHYPVPVFLLAQLAVDVKYQSQGLGKITFIKALEKLWEIHAEMRAFAVIVDCLNGDARRFYEKFGFHFLCNHKGHDRLFIPMKTISLLFR